MNKNQYSVWVWAVFVFTTIISVTNGCSKSASENLPVSSAPVLVGPPGSRFWTTYANARGLFNESIVECTTVHSDHQIGTAQDSYQNRYMSAEKEGDKVELQLVAEADSKYEHVNNIQMLFHRYPSEDAPWIAKTHSAFYIKSKSGEIVRIGETDSQYRMMGTQQGLMTKGLAEGERWTGDANGIIFRLSDEGKMVIVGEYDRRWVTPIGQSERVVLPLMMSKSSIPGSPWIGEFAGILYVEKEVIE